MVETVFITGASGGIGEATARHYAKSGAKLVLTARRIDRLESLAKELGTPCHLAALDVCDADAVNRIVAEIPEEFRDVTILVNNAGLALGLGPAQSADVADWDAMVDTNVKGLLYVTRAILPGMIARNRGHVVNMGSVAATYPYPGGHVYCGTKAFVHQFSLSLRADLLGTRVRVTCIEPGMVETDFSKVRFKGDEAKAAGVYAGADPLTAEDIAETIAWVASRPGRVNVNVLELMTVQQAFSPFAISRK